jgi:hypothetical protein
MLREMRHRHVAQRRLALEQRLDQDARLRGAAAAEPRPGRSRAADGDDLAGVAHEDLLLRASEVVLRQRADLLEQQRAFAIVEPLARKRLGAGRQARSHVGGEILARGGLTCADEAQPRRYDRAR